MLATLLLTGDLVALAAPRGVDLACRSVGGILMYFSISFSSRRARRLTFRVLGEPLTAALGVELACGPVGGVFMYCSISCSSQRARGLTFGALGEPSALKNSPGLYPSGKRGLNTRVPLRGVAGMVGDNARGWEGEDG